VGLRAGRGPHRLVGGGQCINYSLQVSVKGECGGREGKGGEVSRC